MSYITRTYNNVHPSTTLQMYARTHIHSHTHTHTHQQEQVLTELFNYTNQSPPHDAFSVASTRKYLEACNKVFENGFLSHKKIYSSDSEVLFNIQSGFKFFSNSLLEEGRYDTIIIYMYTVGQEPVLMSSTKCIQVYYVDSRVTSAPDDIVHV